MKTTESLICSVRTHWQLGRRTTQATPSRKSTAATLTCDKHRAHTGNPGFSASVLGSAWHSVARRKTHLDARIISTVGTGPTSAKKSTTAAIGVAGIDVAARATSQGSEEAQSHVQTTFSGAHLN